MGREALPEVRDVSRGQSRGPGRVGRPSWRSGMGREALLEVWDRSGGPPEGPGRVRGPPKFLGWVGRPS